MLHQIDLSRADLNLLVVFETVFEERHVGRAAQRLNLSPSAVSHGLSRLRTLLRDPLFLRHPKGVAPTERAAEIALQVGDILARARALLSSTEPFDPARARRRFAIAANDGIAGVLVPRLIAYAAVHAPNLGFGVRDLLPPFADAFEALDARVCDIAIAPLAEAPARFERRPLYREAFVIAMRKGHPLGPRPTLRQYCGARHVLVSHTGDLRGNIDDILEKKGLARQVALAAPSFMTALTAAASSDLVAAAPERLVRLHARGLGLDVGVLPTPFPSEISAIATRAAMEDDGVAWLMDALEAVAADAEAPKQGRKRGRAR